MKKFSTITHFQKGLVVWDWSYFFPLGKEVYDMGFHLTLAIPTPWLFHLQGQVYSQVKSDRQAIPPTSYLIHYLCSSILPLPKKKQQTSSSSRVWYIMIPDKLCWHLNKRVREECLILNWKYIWAWKINKDLLSTPKTEEWCWQTAENYITFK